MPRNRVVRPGRLSSAESTADKLTSSFEYIKSLADDFALIKRTIEGGTRAVTRSKASAGRLQSGVYNGVVGVGK
jgi:hypothetical protein